MGERKGRAAGGSIKGTTPIGRTLSGMWFKGSSLDHMNKLEHMNKRTQRNFNIEYVEEHKKRIEQAKHSLFKLDTLKIALEQQLTELTEVGEGQEIKLSSIVQHTVLLSCQETAVSLEKECEPTSSHSIQESIEHVNLRYERGQILQEEGRKIRKLFQETAREWRELSAQLTNIRKEIAQRERKLELLGQEINVKKEQWIASFAPYSYQEIEALQQEVEIKDQKVEKLKERLEKSRLYIDEREGKKQKAQEQMNQIQLLMTEKASLLKEKKDLIGRKERQIKEQAGTLEIEATLQKVTEKLQEWRNKEQELSQVWHQLREELQQLEREESVANESLKQATARKHKSEEGWNQQLRESLFSSLEEVERALVSTKDMESWKAELDAYRSEETKWALEQSRIQSLLKGQSITEEDWEQWNRARKEMIEKVSEANQEHGATKAILADIQMKHERYLELEEQRRQVVQQKEMHLQLQRVLKGNAFVEYVAQEQLMRVSRDASQRLGLLSRQRYALEVDSNGGFVIRDDANGGVKRPVTSLSGGETFLTSLALALALSAQIQLRGEYPLEFFFLDEGFGTLDQELLETVVSALEQLHTERLAVGVISHVPELRSRLARRLIVEPAEPSGRGSVVHLETM
nr:SbcC/MukB-like Walker B domain-containing protein [Caldalkalibacillus mannanilyticus]